VLRLVGPNGLSEPVDRFLRIGDFHDELFEALVLQRHDDCLLRMTHVPKDQFAVIVKRPGREEPRHIGPKNLDAMPPAANDFGIVLDSRDVRERQF
jgi:hypothetical protein